MVFAVNPPHGCILPSSAVQLPYSYSWSSLLYTVNSVRVKIADGLFAGRDGRCVDYFTKIHPATLFLPNLAEVWSWFFSELRVCK